MLTNGLIETLTSQKIFNHTTQIEAQYKRLDNSFRSQVLKDIFNIKEIYLRDKKYYFILSRISDNDIITVSSDDILLIDGMSIEGLMAAFELKNNGKKQAQGKRRGRPRKHFPYGK